MTTKDEQAAYDVLERAMQGRAFKPPKIADRTLISAKVSKVALEGLRTIAQQLGYTHGGHGNVSMLLEAIGTGTVEVTRIGIAPSPSPMQSHPQD